MRRHAEATAETMPSKFEGWVRNFGVANLSRSMVCSRFAVYKWLNGASMPRTDRMLVISHMSAGELSMADIITHFAEQRGRATIARREAFERRVGASASSSSFASEARFASRASEKE